jgi:histidinol dehydrogenase
MAALPALVAGVGHVSVATPMGRDGRVPDATLAACRVAGVHSVYAMGGAYAIGALAHGTDSVARVDKIVGPGNLYVNLAKRLVYGQVGIDMLAGPSEVLALADDSADPHALAGDLIAQAEHDPHGSAALVTPSADLIRATLTAIEQQLEDLPRAAIVRAALGGAGFAVRTRSLGEAADVASLYAPEHLHLIVRDPWALLPRIANAGAILIGEASSAPIGDYLAGPSHTLPTAGCARFASPLNVDDFVKKTSLICLDEAAAAPLSPLAAVFARHEGLEGHARAAERSPHPDRRDTDSERP